ncbi:MAG: J domain-containing protein [Alphaproteobacteria bacterium]|nr:J domain-containing protein [Alphaproteobacteria bacterium]
MRRAREESLKAPLDLPKPEGRICDAPGCSAIAEHRAPQSRQRLDDFYWFCLDHVRDYNRAWDYYKGMTPEEIEWHLQQDLQWRRPTWPLGGRGAGLHGPTGDAFADVFGLFDESGETPGTRCRHEKTVIKSAEQRALSLLDLDGPANPDHIKARYLELVKRLHPDANGGDKAAEEKLKLVNQAYATLRNSALAR